MQFKLRRCTEADREWAYALKSEVYREVVERQFGAWDEEKQQRLFADRWNPSLAQIILAGNQAIGLLAIEDRRGELWIGEIQLAPDWRNKGIGSTVLHDLLATARAARKPLRLQVLRQNANARRLYERLGFSVVRQTETHHVMEHPAADRP